MNNVTFSGNSAHDGAGCANDQSNPILINTTFSCNDVTMYGGGMLNTESNPPLTNVTFYENSANASGGAIFNEKSNPILTNAILWANSPDQIVDYDTSSTTATYSDVQSTVVFPGTGNINQDPLLVHELLPYDGSFPAMHALEEGSLAIDVGNPDLASCPATDQRGVPRPLDGDSEGQKRCDMHTYEFGTGIIFIFLPLVRR